MSIHHHQSRTHPKTALETQSSISLATCNLTLHAYAERRQRAGRTESRQEMESVVHVPDNLASCIRDGKHNWLVIR